MSPCQEYSIGGGQMQMFLLWKGEKKELGQMVSQWIWPFGWYVEINVGLAGTAPCRSTDCAKPVTKSADPSANIIPHVQTPITPS